VTFIVKVIGSVVGFVIFKLVSDFWGGTLTSTFSWSTLCTLRTMAKWGPKITTSQGNI
jgi:hypothetical protein